MKETQTIQIAIADDHPMVADGIQKMLAAYTGLQVDSICYTGAALLNRLAVAQPDVLLLDMQLPDYIGEDLAPLLLERYPTLRILVVSSVDTDARIKYMMRIGCAGYVLKNIPGAELAQAIKTVYQGDKYLGEEIKAHFLNDLFHTGASAKTATPLLLTRREKEILQLIAKEYSTKEIADQLYISPFTVENHRKNLILKLGVKNVAGLVRKGMILGLVQ